MLELAANNVQILSLRQILSRLETPFCLLVDPHCAPDSHRRSLHATLDWSFELLTPAAQHLFCQLSYFTDEFSLEEVESRSAEWRLPKNQIPALLLQLVDSSSVMTSSSTGGKKYWLVKSTQSYAADKLIALAQPFSVGVPKALSALGHDAVGSLIAITDEPKQHNPTISVIRSEKPLLSVHALGRGQVHFADHLIASNEWGYAKSREMLFYLLSHAAQTKEQIGLALWPDASHTQLRDNFRATLHHLRHTLGNSDWVIFENKYYSFNAGKNYRFDVHAFGASYNSAKRLLNSHERGTRKEAIRYLMRAVDLYAGDFLIDLRSEWHISLQEELRRKYLESLVSLGQLHFAEGDYESAAEDYRRILAKDIYLEVAHRGLMLCYEQQGERIQAIRHYQHLVDLVREEMDIMPAPETLALAERLCQGLGM